MVAELTASLRTALEARADSKVKARWERHVKGGAPSLGVKMPLIREALHTWYEESVAGSLEEAEQVDLALALFEGEHTEEKLAGTLFLAEILIPAGAVRCDRDTERFGRLFGDGLIYDWNVCDWFCVKVLGPLIRRNGPACARRIGEWRTADDLWQARASLVAFVHVAGDRAYYPAIEQSCRVLLGREERFAKTAVGRILREISRHDEAFVRRVIDGNLDAFSAESLNNATKRLDAETRERYLRMLDTSSTIDQGVMT